MDKFQFAMENGAAFHSSFRIFHTFAQLGLHVYHGVTIRGTTLLFHRGWIVAFLAP